MGLFGKSDEQKAAESEYEALLQGMASGSVELVGLSDQLTAAGAAARVREKKQSQLVDRAFRGLVERVLEDDVLTPEEEAEVLSTGAAVGIDNTDLNERFPDLTASLVIAGANSGRLPVEPDPHLMAKSGEEVHLELPAHLMKHVTQREFRGGSSGVSIPIGGGVRVRTGGFRGKSVVTGTSVEPADTGILSVTSKRTVFQGAKKTQECRYDKLVGMETFTDGVQLSVSNRQTPSLFGGMLSGPLVAAVVNTAVNRLEES